MIIKTWGVKVVRGWCRFTDSSSAGGRRTRSDVRDSSWKTDLIWSRLNLRRVQSFFLSCEPSADCSHTWSQVVITQPVQEHKLSSLSHRQVWLVFSLDSTRAHPRSVPETDFREHRSRSSTNTGIIRDMILCNQRCVRKTKPVNVKL